MSALPWPPSAHYWTLMYIGLPTSDTLHKKPCRIGPGIMTILQPDFRERQNAKFAEFYFHALG
jgi:hypothetical protein